jgi:hypothetical protein
VALGLIREFGMNLERAWRELNFERRGFPQLCAEQLEAARLHERVDPRGIVDAVMKAELPQQLDPKGLFGQPPVTVFRARRFYIDVLFWVDGTTTIHDHGFSGAFQVLVGKSIETNFAFVPTHDVDGHFKFGDLQVTGSALRCAGDVRAVPAGPSYIHSLFHLLRPSLSLVVRTFRDPATGTQYDYDPSGIAFDPFLEDPSRERMIQILDMMRRTEHPDLGRVAGDLVATCETGTAFLVVRAVSKAKNANLVEEILDRVREPETSRRLRNWVKHRRTSDLLVDRRALVHDPDLRFLLAVLLNAQRRSDALALVESYAPGKEASRQIAKWLAALSNVSIRLQVGGAPFEPNVLGLPSFSEASESALADLLAGRERAWSADERTFLDRLRGLPPLGALFS